MAWGDLTNNQMVSFTDAQGGGFTLQSGQSNVTSNQCMTKSQALAKYVLDSDSMSSYSSSQLVPKSTWVTGIVNIAIQTTYYYFYSSNDVCTWNIEYQNLSTYYTPPSGLVNGVMIYNNSSLGSPLYTVPDDSKWYFALEGAVKKYYRIDSDGYTVKDVGTCA